MIKLSFKFVKQNGTKRWNFKKIGQKDENNKNFIMLNTEYTYIKILT